MNAARRAALRQLLADASDESDYKRQLLALNEIRSAKRWLPSLLDWCDKAQRLLRLAHPFVAKLDVQCDDDLDDEIGAFLAESEKGGA